jgi:hypothetical protein
MENLGLTLTIFFCKINYEIETFDYGAIEAMKRSKFICFSRFRAVYRAVEQCIIGKRAEK